jgi:hypothetical protein
MARRRSQKNKKTTPKENKEVTLEILLFDCSNYDSWSTRVINAFRTVDPQLEQIIDKSIFTSSYNKEIISEEDQRCFRLNYLAYDILSNSLSNEDYRAFISNYNESVMMHMIFGLELKSSLMSPNIIVHYVLLLPLVFLILTLARKKKKMTDGDQTMNPPLQKVCLPISIPTYVVWLMKIIAEAQTRMRRKKEASCNSTLA